MKGWFGWGDLALTRPEQQLKLASPDESHALSFDGCIKNTEGPRRTHFS